MQINFCMRKGKKQAPEFTRKRFSSYWMSKANIVRFFAIYLALAIGLFVAGACNTTGAFATCIGNWKNVSRAIVPAPARSID
jgi:hypothetical protein